MSCRCLCRSAANDPVSRLCRCSYTLVAKHALEGISNQTYAVASERHKRCPLNWPVVRGE